MKSKTFVTHYVTMSNIDIVYQLLKNINKNSTIAAIVIPHSATWCQDDIAVENRNTVTLDKDYMHKYCETMHITERTFKKIIKELQPVVLRKKDKDTYYVNPFWCAHGSNDDIKEFREYCVQHKLFIPFSMVGKICKGINEDYYNYMCDNTPGCEIKQFLAATAKNEEDLRAALDSEPLACKHSCLYTNLSRVSHFSAFIDAKLSTTDVFLFLMLSSMCNFVKNQSDAEHNNIITMSIKEQQKIAKRLDIKDRALRDCLKKMTDLHLLHKCEAENGKYIVNPCLCAKGEQSRIQSLQHNFQNKFSSYFDGCAGGDIKDSNKQDDGFIDENGVI